MTISDVLEHLEKGLISFTKLVNYLTLVLWVIVKSVANKHDVALGCYLLMFDTVWR